VNPPDGVAAFTGCLARESPLQHHLRALWEDEVVKEAGDAGQLIESEFFQRGKSGAFAGRSDGYVWRIVEANLDELE